MAAAFAIDHDAFIDLATVHFARSVVYNIINVYAAKVAGAFLISTSTLALYTGMAPRWMALAGYLLAAFLLFGGNYVPWTIVLFPLWIFLISVHILLERGLARG